MTNHIKDMSPEDLYTQYHKHVAKNCRIAQSNYSWIISPSEAIQVGWLSFIVMMENYEPLEEEGNFLSLVGTRVRGAILDEVRRLCGRKVVKGVPQYSMRWLETPLEETTEDTNQIPVSLHCVDPIVPEVPLEGLIGKLKDQQKDVIRGMYQYDKTMVDIAQYLNVTESRVSQIHQEALAKLRWHHREVRYAA